jgi:hypothetical protein
MCSDPSACVGGLHMSAMCGAAHASAGQGYCRSVPCCTHLLHHHTRKLDLEAFRDSFIEDSVWHKP